MRFADRWDAGERLGAVVADAYPDLEMSDDVLVLGLPRGGVPVAAAVAARLRAALDVFCVRKVGVPGHAELAMGAIAGGGSVVRNEQVLLRSHISDDQFEAVAARERTVLDDVERSLRGDRPPIEASGRRVVVVDDGVATGASARVALQAVRALDPALLVLAVPVGPADSTESLRADSDDVLVVVTPDYFGAVGSFYGDFAPVGDDEVRRLLG